MTRAFIAAAIAATMLVSPATAGEFYADGSAINLVSLRDNVARSSGGDAEQMLYRTSVLDTRFGSDANRQGWWEVEFANAYNVKNYEFCIHTNQWTRITYRVEARVEVSEGVWDWVEQTDWLVEGNGVDKTQNPLLTGYFQGDGLNAKGVRLVVQEYLGYENFCLVGVNITGTNSLPVTPNLSLAQSGWNNATATVNGAERPELIDDFANRFWGGNNGWFSGNDEIIVTLDDVYAISSVGLSVGYPHAFPDTVRILISPDPTGDNWIEATESFAFTYDANRYCSISLIDESGKPRNAQRIQFDLGGTFIIEQLYVYGNAIPEPATMSLLALGAMGLLRRRR